MAEGKITSCVPYKTEIVEIPHEKHPVLVPKHDGFITSVKFIGCGGSILARGNPVFVRDDHHVDCFLSTKMEMYIIGTGQGRVELQYSHCTFIGTKFKIDGGFIHYDQTGQTVNTNIKISTKHAY